MRGTNLLRSKASSRLRGGQILAKCIEPLESRLLMSGSIQVTVVNDLNADGAKDAFEPGLAGWTVFIDSDRDGVLDPSETSLLTDANGQAVFTGLANGKTDVREILPSGWSPSPGLTDLLRVNVSNNQTTPAIFLNTTGLPTTGSAGGTVWNDINGDGIRQAGDVGIPGWTVFIDLNTNRVRDAGEPFATTDANGVYNIPNLAPGTYKVRDITPSGWDATVGFDGQSAANVVAGKTAVNDFGNFNVASIGSIQGTVWNDVNADGFRASSDVGMSGWTVFLDLDLNGSLGAGEPSTVTDAGGNYAFPSVVVGNYRVAEVLQPGWNTSPGHPVSQNITVVNEGLAHTDFANFTPTLGAISGKVWNDLNGDGILGAAEPGLAGWTVFIDQNSDGAANAGEPTAVTDASGNYTIASVPVGSNLLRELAPVGWSATAPGTGMQLVNVPNGTTVPSVNFGNKQRTDGAISGIVFFDANHNGVRDAAEHGLAGIAVYLDTNDNGAQDAGEPTTVSSTDLFYTPAIDETGAYSFSHLATGTFHVREVLPAVLSGTPDAARVQNVDLAPGEDRRNVNFADVFRANEIHGMIFDDVNKNGVRDAGEAGIGGVWVYLDLNRNNVRESAEPKTITAADGSYSFATDLAPGSYVIRELRHSGREHSYPVTPTGGILWPSGVSHPAVGNVSPTSITTSLAEGQVEHDTVSLTLPGSGSISNMVDVFLLFDDTGSFTANSPIVRAAFPQIISALQTAMPSVDFGFGVGRFEEYANFAAEFATGRPFILNQPIIGQSTPGFATSIQAALDRTAPGYGGDQPETDIEALYQVATGRGFDGNNNGTTSDSGAAGQVSTQLTPGNSGDVPSFSSFTVDASGNVLPAAGSVGGAGFRAGALPIILVATDTGFAFQPGPGTTITGLSGKTLPLSAFTQTSRPTTPFGSGATIQDTVTALNALGALVIGLGTNGGATIDPRQGLEALATITGATNQSLTTIPNGTLDPIAPGDPFYFQISSGFGASVANGIVAAIQNAASNVAVNLALKASDPSVHIVSTPGVINGLSAGQTGTFDVTFTGDGRPHRFDLQFVRQGTDVVLGSIPVVIGTPVQGDGYEYEDLHDGDISEIDDFGGWYNPALPVNTAPTYTKGADESSLNDSGKVTIPGWAKGISAGSPTETDQAVDFSVSSDNSALFAAPPTIGPDGSLSYTPAPGAVGSATVTVRLRDSGGTLGGGSDTSAAQTFTISLTARPPLAITTNFASAMGEGLTLDFSADVAGSMTPGVMQIVNVATGQSVTPQSVAYDSVLHRAIVAFDPNAMVDGNYRLTIAAGALPGLAAAHQYDFFILAGDVNRDRAVDFLDLAALAQNYNSTGKTWAQGDFNGDGNVDFLDLARLAQRYNSALPAPSVSAAPAGPVSVSSAPMPSLASVIAQLNAPAPVLPVVTATKVKLAPVAKPVPKPKPVVKLAPKAAPMKKPTLPAVGPHAIFSTIKISKSKKTAEIFA
ncbi:MAG: Cna B-type [Phycisphaerales bacterium]|nr:Cna B-type [Phycisphaerales bacterium]